MATASTIGQNRAGRRNGLIAAFAQRPLLNALTLIAVIVAIRAVGPVDADVSWQLWVAHQLSGGVRLYADIVEPNPPLWYWMAIPVDALARLLGTPAAPLLVAVVGTWAALSLVATDRLLGPVGSARRTLLLAYAALILVAMPWLEFGQREHLALIGAVPYAALIAARRAGRPAGAALAILVGAGAAMGFALKHYFLLVPILLELWLLAGVGRKWRPWRPETIAVASVGCLYALALGLFASDYFSVTLPMLRLSYGATGAQRAVDLFQPAVLTALATLALLVAHPRALRSERSGFGAALVIAAAGFGASYFIQAKGWSYQAVPLSACAAIALAASLAGEVKPRFVALAAPALLVLPFWTGAQHAMRHSDRDRDVTRAVEGLHAGDSVGFIGTDPSFGWPATLERGLSYPSRYSSFWMMRAIVDNDQIGHGDRRLAALGREIVRQTAQDFACDPPRRIIVARPTAAAAASGEFDILAFFLRDPEFADLIAHYQPVQRTSVEVFELASPPSRNGDCIRRVKG
jgi:hypothetical protein